MFDEQAEPSDRAPFVLDEAGIVRWSDIFPAAIDPGVDGIVTALETLPDRLPGRRERVDRQEMR